MYRDYPHPVKAHLVWFSILNLTVKTLWASSSRPMWLTESCSASRNDSVCQRGPGVRRAALTFGDGISEQRISHKHRGGGGGMACNRLLTSGQRPPPHHMVLGSHWPLHHWWRWPTCRPQRDQRTYKHSHNTGKELTNEKQASNILWLQVSRTWNLKGMKAYSFTALKWESLAHQI